MEIRWPDAPPVDEIYLNEPPIAQKADEPALRITSVDAPLAPEVSVNPSSRQESFDFFWSQYEMTTTPPISWTGTYTPCNPGTTSAEFKAAIAQRINYYRAMGGMPATITFSDTLNALDQEAALMMSLNGLNHYPPSTWTCYTTNGYDAAGSSNLSRGTGGLGYGWNAITAYIQDKGASNTAAGHRRWILYPNQQVMGTGDVPPSGAQLYGANALWTDNFGPTRPSTRDEYVAWPPPGYAPHRVVYPRWSFSYPDADFTNATVSMISQTVPLTVTIHPVYPAYGSGSYIGDETLVWVPAGYNTDGSGAWAAPPAGQDVTITVSISNVIVAGVARQFAYTVVVFNDDVIAPTGAVTINLGAEYTNNANLSLSVPAADYRGVTDMRFYTGTVLSWEAYASGKTMNLGTGQGVKSVSAQFKDEAGNQSGWYTDTIILDTAAPTGAILVNNGAVYAMSVTQANLTAFDNYSLTQMNLRVNGIWLGWEPFSVTRQVTFATLGLNTVYAQFQDAAGNISNLYSDGVTADFFPPANGSVVINGGALSTTNPAVTLTLAATDNYSLTQVNLNVDGVWQGWVPYGATKNVAFTWPDGTQTVLAKFRDAAGNESATYTDTITLDTTPPAGALSINNNATYATAPTVTLALTATDNIGMANMRLLANGAWGAWQTYAPSAQVVLNGVSLLANRPSRALADGLKTVGAQYQDAAGNASPIYTQTIILDTTPPTGTIVVNTGATYANTTTLTATISATDDTGVTQMRLAYNGVTYTWQPYATTATLVITDGNTTPTINAQFMDAAGNISAYVFDGIVIDMTPPTASINLNGGAVYANASPATAVITAADNWSLSVMQVSIDGALQSWEAVSPTRQVALAGEGVHTVTLHVSDQAGNVSAWYTDTIILDTTPPTGTILVNAGATYATSATLTLTLSASDANGVTQMRLYYNGFWRAWQAYATSATIVITDGNTAPVINVQYLDAAGNGSGAAFDGIVIDMTPPTGSIALNGGAAYANASPLTAIITAADNIGLDQMQLTIDGVLQSWEAINTAKNVAVSGEGTHTVSARFSDQAGNQSGWYTDTIILDTTPPAGTALVNNGAAYANTTTLTLTLSATDNYSVAQMRFYYDGFWHPWQPYALTATIAITSGDTAPAINAQFLDGAGNGSSPAVDGIWIDTIPPTASITLNSGAVYATASPVFAGIGVADNMSLANMQLAYDGVLQAWEPVAGSKNVPLTGDGAHTVTVRASDQAGNVSAWYTDTIILDTTRPTGTVSINNGAAYMNMLTSTVSFSATDNISLTQMNIYLDGVWLGWEPYAPTKTVVFTGGDGVKYLNVNYRDAAGNQLAVAALDSIIMDTVAPSSTVLALPGVVASPFAVSWSWYGSEVSGVKCYDVQSREGSAGAWAAWQTCTTTTTAPFTGQIGATYYFRSSAIDNANNAEGYPIGPDYDASACVDVYESNNTSAQAAAFTPFITQTQAFCAAADVDWVKFNAQGGAKYGFATTGVTTTLDLFGADGVTLLASGVNSIPARAFAPGVYYLRVRNTSSLIGRYDLLTSGSPPRVVYVPSTLKAYVAGW